MPMNKYINIRNLAREFEKCHEFNHILKFCEAANKKLSYFFLLTPLAKLHSIMELRVEPWCYVCFLECDLCDEVKKLATHSQMKRSNKSIEHSSCRSSSSSFKYGDYVLSVHSTVGNHRRWEIYISTIKIHAIPYIRWCAFFSEYIGYTICVKDKTCCLLIYPIIAVLLLYELFIGKKRSI